MTNCLSVLPTSHDQCFFYSHMTKKLFAFAKGECAAESADNVVFQEALLGGHLYQMALKVRFPKALMCKVPFLFQFYSSQ